MCRRNICTGTVTSEIVQHHYFGAFEECFLKIWRLEPLNQFRCYPVIHGLHLSIYELHSVSSFLVSLSLPRSLSLSLVHSLSLSLEVEWRRPSAPPRTRAHWSPPHQSARHYRPGEGEGSTMRHCPLGALRSLALWQGRTLTLISDLMEYGCSIESSPPRSACKGRGCSIFDV
jgi:hypothetical protein